MKMSKFEVYKGKSDWRWRLRANNGKIVAQGEGFISKQNAMNSVEVVTECAAWAVLGVLNE